MQQTEHYSVLLAETLEWMNLHPEGVYLDATTGLGGHTAAMAGRLTSGTVIACDRDAQSLEMARARIETCGWLGRVKFQQTRFTGLTETIKKTGLSPVNGLVADLGISRMQLTTPERGFSIQHDGFLDMRMSQDDEEGITAADIVNTWKEREIADLIYELAEERRSYRIAKALVRARPIRTTKQLAEVVAGPAGFRAKIHPATKTFMALRMKVNDELGEVQALLDQIPDLVKPGGRAVIITFHSLEDRLVKQGFQRWAKEGRAKILTKHVVTPSSREVAENAASRSAKLRAMELI
jgi:16S rRNA (cytosine1402-N4)-methyltransferase